MCLIFIDTFRAKLGIKAKHRQIHRKGKGQDTVYALQEPIAAYSDDFGGKIESLRAENGLLWNEFNEI